MGISLDFGGTEVAKSRAAMRLVIVKKGAFSTFRFLEQSCRDIAGLRVIWDRRNAERRRAPAAVASAEGVEGEERRGSDRRRQPPHSWTAADHVLTDAPVDENRPVEGVETTTADSRA